MSMKSLLVIVTALIAFSDSAFAQCNGGACGDLRVQQQGGCVVLANANPKRAIKVVSDSRPSSVYDVPANSSITPNVIFGPGVCHKTWFQKYSANYM